MQNVKRIIIINSDQNTYTFTGLVDDMEQDWELKYAGEVVVLVKKKRGICGLRK